MSYLPRNARPCYLREPGSCGGKVSKFNELRVNVYLGLENRLANILHRNKGIKIYGTEKYGLTNL